MKAVITGEFGMERGHRDHALTCADDPLLSIDDNAREFGHANAEPLDRWRTNEHCMHRLAERADVEIGLERIGLTTEGVTSNSDINRAKRLLIWTTVEHHATQKDHAGARAERRHAGLEARLERLSEPRGVEEHHQRRGLTSGDHDRIDTIKIIWEPYESDTCPEPIERGDMLGDVSLKSQDTDSPG